MRSSVGVDETLGIVDVFADGDDVQSTPHEVDGERRVGATMGKYCHIAHLDRGDIAPAWIVHDHMTVPQHPPQSLRDDAAPDDVKGGGTGHESRCFVGSSRGRHPPC